MSKKFAERMEKLKAKTLKIEVLRGRVRGRLGEYHITDSELKFWDEASKTIDGKPQSFVDLKHVLSADRYRRSNDW